MDEVAARVKADPVEFRLRHLSDPAAERRGEGRGEGGELGCASFAKRRGAADGSAAGRGIACVAYEGDNGYAAMVAEVEVDQETGKVSVKRIVVSNDSGPISNPDGLRNQIEGGALQGMSRALGEEVTWDDQKVTSVDWQSYHSLPLGFDIPESRSDAAQPPRSARDRRGRDGHHPRRGGDRKCDFRRHGRAHPASSVHAGAREGRAQPDVNPRLTLFVARLVPNSLFWKIIDGKCCPGGWAGIQLRPCAPFFPSAGSGSNRDAHASPGNGSAHVKGVFSRAPHLVRSGRSLLLRSGECRAR